MEHRLYTLAVTQLSSRLAGPIYMGDIKYSTTIFEVVVSHDRWIGYAFFRVDDFNNDINVLNQSPLFVDVIRGRTHKVFFTVNDREYHMRYYLTDGIYLS
jgi:hypothetical protein